MCRLYRNNEIDKVDKLDSIINNYLSYVQTLKQCCLTLAMKRLRGNQIYIL